MKQHVVEMDRALGPTVIAACLGLGLLWAVPSGAEGQGAEAMAERRCRPRAPIINMGRCVAPIVPEIDSRLHLLELQDRLRANPQEDDEVWWTMWGLMGSVAGHDEEVLRRQSAARHWELRDDGLFGPQVLDKRYWLHQWLAAKPRSESAWDRWRELEQDLFGVEKVLATLRRQLELDPGNTAVLRILREVLIEEEDEEALVDLNRRFALSPDQDEWDDFDLTLLPEPTRGLWRSYRFVDGEAQLRLLEDYFEGLPEGSPIDHALRLQFLGLADIFGEEDIDILASLRSMLAEGPTMLNHHRICGLLKLKDEDEAFAACTRDVLARAEAAGLHLRGAVLGENPRDIQRWSDLRAELQDELIRRAVAAVDGPALESLLVDGPDQGYAHRWSLSLAEMDQSLLLVQAMENFHRGVAPPDGDSWESVDFGDPEVQADVAAIKVEAIENLKAATCARLDVLEMTGELRGYVHDAAASCPARVGAMAEAFRSCRRAASLEHLEASVGERLHELDLDALMVVELPIQARLAELDRRRAEPMDQETLRYLHRLTIDLRLGSGEIKGLGAQLDDWAVADAYDLRSWLRTEWFLAERVVALAAASLSRVSPTDAVLHLKVAFEALFPEARHPPDLAKARARLELVSGLDLTVRQRAEAHYMFGRLLVLEERFEEATFHLSRFFDPFLIHGGCTASRPSCDRDYMLHLSAVGDRARLESYWQRRQEAVDRSRRQVETDGYALGSIVELPIFEEDPVVNELFMESGCGSESGAARLRALLAGPETDETIRRAWRRRLEAETTLPCVRAETPSPWQADGEDPNGRVAAASILYADDFPSPLFGS